MHVSIFVLIWFVCLFFVSLVVVVAVVFVCDCMFLSGHDLKIVGDSDYMDEIQGRRETTEARRQ